MAFCPECGKELTDGANFCKYCGFLLTGENDANPAAETESTPVIETTTEYISDPGNQPTPAAVVEPSDEPAAQPAQAADYDFYTIKDSLTTQNGPDEPYMPEPKKKSPLKYILIAVGAVILVAAIVLSIIFLPDLLNKKEDLDTEEKLTAILEEETSKDIIEFIYEDFDADETYEAYAVVGKTENKDDKHPTFSEAEIYFVTQEEAEKIEEKISGKVNGEIEVDDITYVSIEIYEEGKESGYSYLYTADDGKSVKHEQSGKYSEVYQKDDKIYGKDASGNEVEIDLSGKPTSSQTTNPSEESTTSQSPAPEESTTRAEDVTREDRTNPNSDDIENTTNRTPVSDETTRKTPGSTNRIEFTTRQHLSVN